MKIQLLNSPLPNYISTCLRSKCYPPLSLVSLATYIHKKLPLVNIEILDGEIFGIDALIEKADSDIIGISSNSLSYESAVEIAEKIKKRNPKSTIILGGAHATHLFKEILFNRKCFDVVVLGQGEQTIVDILSGIPLKKIQNCAYFENGCVRISGTKRQDIQINALPFPDYSILSLEEYYRNFQIHYPEKMRKYGMPIYSSTGCYWREKTGGCTYCSIPNKEYSIIDPELYWDYIISLVSNLGIDFIWDVSDTFTSDIQWLKHLANSAPKNIDVNFHVYARIDDLSEFSISLLKKIGIREILVGIESFDNRMLNSAHKGINQDSVINALYLLNRYNIDVAVSFVLGLPDEDETSLNNTLKCLKDISWMNNIIENHTSILIPLPGSDIYNRILRDPMIGKKYLDKDIVNLSELQKDYLDKFTVCGSDVVFDYYLKIDSIFKSAGPFFIDKRAPIYRNMNFKEEKFDSI